EHDLLPPTVAREAGSEDVPNWEWGLRIKGYADDAGSSVQDQAISLARVEAVTDALVGLGVDLARIRKRAAYGDAQKATVADGLDEALGGTGPWATDHNRRVVVELHDAVLAGEHGFRFFPGYYNHLRDTLKRIPLLDDLQRETGRTVHDLLQSTRVQGLVGKRVGTLLVPRAPVRSLRAMLASAK
ncbi:MAG: OmpA family protein, partial [Myxococcales bacterium]|nr:OmpA family protein [Myxococcales bacterium]